MTELLWKICFVVLLMTVFSLSAPVPDDRNTAIVLESCTFEGGTCSTPAAKKYLILYKYLATPEGEVRPTDLKLALEEFQRNNKLDVTGVLNSATEAKMKNPTCRETDYNGLEKPTRTRRYTVAQGVKWTKTDITYNVLNAPPFLSKLQTESVFRQAFDSWQNVCGLTFTHSDDPSADIIITFYRGYHGDRQVFDGQDGILAHAILPLNNGQGIYGDIHLDIEEHWVVGNGGKNLYQVALHEIGHTLGLGHSEANTVMHALYNPSYDPNFGLQTDDIMGAQFLYGPNAEMNTVPGTIPSPGGDMPDDTCVHSVDAIATLFGESVLAFMGQEVLKMSTKGFIEDGYPKLLTEVFGDIMSPVSHIDAAVMWPSGILFLFVGSQYYRFSLTSFEIAHPWPLDEGFPKPIAGNWNGIPNDLDSATMTPINEMYFFKGNQYFKYGYQDGFFQVLTDYPKLIASNSKWAALGAVDIRAATLWSDGNFYLFTAENFYVMNGNNEFLHPGYPRSFREEWFACDIME